MFPVRNDAAIPAAEAVTNVVSAASARTTVHRRTLGLTMPTIDYAAFKRLEARSAAPDDPEVIRVAREAMTDPVGPLKISPVIQTPQATAVNKALGRKVSDLSLHSFNISLRGTAGQGEISRMGQRWKQVRIFDPLPDPTRSLRVLKQYLNNGCLSVA